MLERPHRSTRRSAHHLLVGLLLCALSVYGMAAVVADLLGALHFHAARSMSTAAVHTAAMAGWHDFRRASPSADLNATARPAHAHAGLQRHRHGAHDTTVTAIDGEAAGDAAVQDGSVPAAALVLAVPQGGIAAWRGAAHQGTEWMPQAACRYSSCAGGRLERPPRV